MEKSNLTAEVYKRSDVPSSWGVEAIDFDNEGRIYMAVFTGPDARVLANEYATSKYVEVKLS